MTKGERDFNNFLLTPLDMPMRMGTALNFVQRDVTVLLELVD